MRCWAQYITDSFSYSGAESFVKLGHEAAEPYRRFATNAKKLMMGARHISRPFILILGGCPLAARPYASPAIIDDYSWDAVDVADKRVLCCQLLQPEQLDGRLRVCVLRSVPTVFCRQSYECIR